MAARSAVSCVVGVASSAGGLEALLSLLGALPPGTGAAIVVAQHMAPDHASLLPQLLGRESRLPVGSVVDGEAPRPDHVHVCPPGHDVVLERGRLTLLPPDRRPGTPRPSADRLFASLAADRGDRCAAIVLSGTGSDGAYGLRAVREAGGVTVAQELATARHDGMPAAAIATGCVDVVLPPAEIGARLPRILEGSREPLPDDAGDDLADLAAILLARTRVDFRDYKEATLRRRIGRRMAALGIADLGAYVQRLRTSPTEVGALYRDLLISVTRFYRDPEAFHALADALAQRVEAAPDQPIRAWVAGCATGEEAYTVASVIAEVLGGVHRLTRDAVQIFATDIDRDALRVARAGRYPIAAAGDIPRRALERHFLTEGVELMPRPELRQVVLFSQHNVFADAPFINIDLATLRNVLIYFNPRLQQRTLSRIHFAVRDEGLVLLGQAEKPIAAPGRFEALTEGSPIYRKVGLAAGRGRRERLEAGTFLPSHAAFDAGARAVARPDREAERRFGALVRQLGPDGVLVDAENQILAVFGDVSPHVALSGGLRPRMDLRLLRPPLAAEATSLVLLALRDDRRRVGLWHPRPDGSGGQMRLVAYPLEMEGATRQALVVFERAEPPAPGAPAGAAEGGAGEGPGPNVEAELAATREMLQRAVEELQASNEEMQSANEEVQSANEELQAANEELQTSNEELSSTNEELITVNEELQVSSSELAVRTGELAAVLDSAPMKIIVVDTALQVTSVSGMAQEVFGLDASVIGTHLGLVLLPPAYPDAVAPAARAVRDGVMSEATFEDGRFQVTMRCAPWSDQTGRTRGAVLAFSRFDRQAERMLLRERAVFQEAVERMEDISHVRFDVRTGAVEWTDRVLEIRGLPAGSTPPSVEEAIAAYHPDDRPAIEAAFRACVEEGRPYELRSRLRRPDGRLVEVEMTGGAVIDPETGDVASVVGVFRQVRPGDGAPREALEGGPDAAAGASGSEGVGPS